MSEDISNCAERCGNCIKYSAPRCACKIYGSVDVADQCDKFVAKSRRIYGSRTQVSDDILEF